MADYIVKDTELTSVANSIRTAGGTSSLLTFPDGFISAINNISGGNPNRVQLIEGTVSAPMDANMFRMLSANIAANYATAICQITLGEQNGVAYLWGANHGTQLQGIASMIDTDGFLTVSVGWDLINGNIRLGHFESIQGASGAYQVTDLKSMAAMCPTELAIIWHPLPD